MVFQGKTIMHGTFNSTLYFVCNVCNTEMMGCVEQAHHRMVVCTLAGVQLLTCLATSGVGSSGLLSPAYKEIITSPSRRCTMKILSASQSKLQPALHLEVMFSPTTMRSVVHAATAFGKLVWEQSLWVQSL